ncbi:MAG: peptide-methionine (S)-S-oxide reductase MsrA [Halapricum sp.]
MTETATLGGGCFWCIEAALQELQGVESVTSGYAGGTTADPTYQEVCSGTTGHAEVVQIEYDPETISYLELLEVFFKVHDPTTKDRQGPDVGSQYRSIVLYHDDDQREQAEGFIERLNEEVYDGGIVTEVESLDRFYEAEDYHQNYYEKNPSDGYCQVQVEPKVEKVREEFADLLTAQ